MACGAPVLAARTGGLPELITDGLDGILEPPGSVEAMARRAVSLLRDPEEHASMRQAALRRAASFSAASVVPAYEAFYQEILSR
jgi:glycosyltransferase involved in cell wall biosynthesis